jgi:hypothetical protein
MFEVTVASAETGAVYYLQVFTKLDVSRLVKELNTAYWAEMKVEPEKDEEAA